MPGQGTLSLLIITVFVTAVGVLLVTTYGKLLLAAFSKPFTYAGERIYRWLAPRIPFFIPVISYRKHVRRSKLGYMETPVGPDIAVPLERAFAPLRLISSAQEHGVELFTLAANNDRFILLGGPGTGKTTLMKNLVINALNRVTHTKLDQLTPVFVELRHLATARHTIEQAIIAAFDRYHFPGAGKFVRAAVSQGKLLIILDGLDEVGVNGSFVAEKIRDFCNIDNQQISRNTVIVTCRENSYRTEDLRAVIPTVVRVESFSNHHMRLFLQGWPAYQDRMAIRLYPEIQRDPQIRDVCKNPLMLTILTGLYLETETEDFEVPATRDRFYTAAIEEYIVKRPERKGLIQDFYPEAKKQILERSSLARLEIVDPTEDPEELDVKVITRHANEAIQGDFDRRELIKELVETNGILKPASDGSYVFVHRTIQEYLAASEALRIRTTEEVLERFGARQELSEVLNFYCGLIRNVPQTSLVLKHFSDPDEWLRAGQCLLHMMEVPSAGQVHEISQSLFNSIERGGEYRQELEVLSSLAQRQSSVFEPAKLLFAEAVNLLTHSEEASGTSALESVLAANPEVAVTIIPALRAHGSEELRRAGVRLLRDIETEEAIDQLFQILGGPDGPEKSEAAWVISDLVATRKDELIERASLLPPDENLAIWPIETYLPSRLAVPIARALSPEIETGDSAINLAARAAREIQKGAGGDTRFLRQWRNVLRDVRLARIRTVFAATLMNVGLWSAVIGVVAILALAVWARTTDRTLVLQIDPLNLQPATPRDNAS